MIKRDALTPCSSGEFLARLKAAVAELDGADRDLYNAWADRNDARWPRASVSLADMRPDDDPRVVEAEAKIEAVHARWRAVHAQLVQFVGAPLDLVCAVEDWRVSQWRPRARCTLPAAHGGNHSFEEQKPDARPVSQGSE